MRARSGEDSVSTEEEGPDQGLVIPGSTALAPDAVKSPLSGPSSGPK